MTQDTNITFAAARQTWGILRMLAPETPGLPTEVLLAHNEIVLGRVNEAKHRAFIELKNDFISASHCKIFRDGRKTFLEVHSRNTILIDGESVRAKKKKKLFNGSRIAFKTSKTEPSATYFLELLEVQMDIIEGLNQELKASEAQCTTLQADNDELNSSLDDVKQELSDKKKYMTKLENKFAEIVKEKRELEEKNRNEIKALKGKLKVFEDQTEKLEVDNGNLKTELDELKEECSCTKSELSTLKTMHNNTEKELASLTIENNDLESSINEMAKQWSDIFMPYNMMVIGLHEKCNGNKGIKSINMQSRDASSVHLDGTAGYDDNIDDGSQNSVNTCEQTLQLNSQLTLLEEEEKDSPSIFQALNEEEQEKDVDDEKISSDCSGSETEFQYEIMNFNAHIPGEIYHHTVVGQPDNSNAHGELALNSRKRRADDIEQPQVTKRQSRFKQTDLF